MAPQQIQAVSFAASAAAHESRDLPGPARRATTARNASTPPSYTCGRRESKFPDTLHLGKQFTLRFVLVYLGLLWYNSARYREECLPAKLSYNATIWKLAVSQPRRELLNRLTQSQVARRFGVSRTTASRWQRSIIVKGVDGNAQTPRDGPAQPSQADQVETIRVMYCEGARAHGFSTDRWTHRAQAGRADRAPCLHSLRIRSRGTPGCTKFGCANVASRILLRLFL